MVKKILLVDDEPNLLDGIRRQLRNKFEIDTAVGPGEGLRALHSKGPYAVVVSDMRMPEMSGVDFLKEVKILSPTTVRLMLTGNSDQETASLAVNEGNIFRFLSKPCSTEHLIKALSDALEQYSLVMAEKEVLQSTLTGSIKIFSEMLALLSPSLFSEGVRAREFLKRFAEALQLDSIWEIELASMLANLGLIAVPETVIRRYRSGESLNEEELQLITKSPATSAKLISNVPRLDEVARIVMYSRKGFDGSGFPENNVHGAEIPKGARIVRLVLDYAALTQSSASPARAIRDLVRNSSAYDPELLRTFITCFGPTSEEPVIADIPGYQILPTDFCPGQTLFTDVLTIDGTLLIRAGNVLSESSVERLKNYSKLIGLRAPIIVDARIPATAHQ